MYISLHARAYKACASELIQNNADSRTSISGRAIAPCKLKRDQELYGSSHLDLLIRVDEPRIDCAYSRTVRRKSDLHKVGFAARPYTVVRHYSGHLQTSTQRIQITVDVSNCDDSIHWRKEGSDMGFWVQADRSRPG